MDIAALASGNYQLGNGPFRQSGDARCAADAVSFNNERQGQQGRAFVNLLVADNAVAARAMGKGQNVSADQGVYSLVLVSEHRGATFTRRSYRCVCF